MPFNQYNVDDPKSRAAGALSAAAQTTASMDKDNRRYRYGYGIGEEIKDISQAALGFAGLASHVRQQQHNQTVDAYLEQLYADPEFEPDFKAEDFDGKAWNEARVTHFDELRQNEEVKQAEFETTRQKIDTNYNFITEQIKHAEALASMGDKRSAGSKYEAAYEAFSDGTDMIVDYDNNSYQLKHRDGTVETKDFSDFDTMLNNWRSIARPLMDKETFAKTWLGERQARINHNMNALLNSEHFINKEGIQGTRTLKYVNPDTGKIEEVIYEIEGKPVTEEQWKAKGMMPLDQGTATRESEALVEQRVAAAEASQKKGIKETMGSEEKYARALMRHYGIDKGEAMDMVRQDKLNSAAFKVLTQKVEDEWWDLSKPEDMEKFALFRDKLFGTRAAVTKQKDTTTNQKSTISDTIALEYPPDKNKDKEVEVQGVVYKSNGTKWVAMTE